MAQNPIIPAFPIVLLHFCGAQVFLMYLPFSDIEHRRIYGLLLALAITGLLWWPSLKQWWQRFR